MAGRSPVAWPEAQNPSSKLPIVMSASYSPRSQAARTSSEKREVEHDKAIGRETTICKPVTHERPEPIFLAPGR